MPAATYVNSSISAGLLHSECRGRIAIFLSRPQRAQCTGLPSGLVGEDQHQMKSCLLQNKPESLLQMMIHVFIFNILHYFQDGQEAPRSAAAWCVCAVSVLAVLSHTRLLCTGPAPELFTFTEHSLPEATHMTRSPSPSCIQQNCIFILVLPGTWPHIFQADGIFGSQEELSPMHFTISHLPNRLSLTPPPSSGLSSGARQMKSQPYYTSELSIP